MPPKNKGQYDPRQIKGELSRLMRDIERIQDWQKFGILEHGKEDRRFTRLLETDHKTMNQITRLLGTVMTPPLPPPPPPLKKEEAAKKNPPSADAGAKNSPYEPYYAFPEEEDEE